MAYRIDLVAKAMLYVVTFLTKDNQLNRCIIGFHCDPGGASPDNPGGASPQTLKKATYIHIYMYPGSVFCTCCMYMYVSS